MWLADAVIYHMAHDVMAVSVRASRARIARTRINIGTQDSYVVSNIDT